MDARERYLWDLQGHLVVRNVLSTDEIAEVNEALDYAKQNVREGRGAGARGSEALAGTGARWYGGENLLNLQQPYCHPFRRLLAHPQIVSRLNVMCGKGFRLDHGPQFNNAVKGTEGLTLHGAGEPHGEHVAYTHQNGRMYVAGVTVTWNLTDCPGGKGGFAAVPGSHKSKYRMPDGVRLANDHRGSVANPDIRAGDVLFFMDGAQTHGTLPWTNDWERRSVLFKYASRTAVRQGPSRNLCAPETFWGDPTVTDMTPEERAVMFGPCNAPGRDDLYLTVEEGGKVRLEKPESAAGYQE
ncbi:MAG: phytanoyl-CoA dioxygenase family protein [Candidatus Poribacteria bacterium]|nr:phytanoyl-CoA dioxygenase family protein [Candidatus Poribacteria bacterium]